MCVHVLTIGCVCTLYTVREMERTSGKAEEL